MNLNKIFKNDIVSIGTKFDYIYGLEIKGVLEGFKKIAKLEPFTLSNLNDLNFLFNNLGLKYIYFKKKSYFDYNKMLFYKGSNGKDIFIDIYISKSFKVLNILNNILEEENNIYKKNYLIGRLLGYPDCCIKYFLKKNYIGDFNFNLQIKDNTIGKMDWRLNNLINPYSLIPFFPCSYNCKEAIKYAENNINILGNRNEIKYLFNNIIEYNGFWEYKISNSNSNSNIFNFKM